MFAHTAAGTCHRFPFCLRSLSTHTSASQALKSSLFSDTPRKGSRASIRYLLERPIIVLCRNSDLVVFAQTGLHAKEKPSRMWPRTSARGLHWRAYLNFARCLFSLCNCMCLLFLTFCCLFGCISSFRFVCLSCCVFCASRFVRARLRIFCLCTLVRRRLCLSFCTRISVRARLCNYFSNLWVQWWAGPRDAAPVVQPRPAPSGLSFPSGVGPKKPCAQVGSAQHIPVIHLYVKVNPRPQQLEGSAKPSTPSSPCTTQKSLHMTDKANVPFKKYSRTNVTWFSVQHVSTYVMAWLKSIVLRRDRSGKPETSQ